MSATRPPSDNPDLQAAIKQLEREIQSVRAQLSGVPAERRKGLWELLDQMEENHRKLTVALDTERQARRDALERERDARHEDTSKLESVVKEVQVNLMMAEVKVRWAMWGLSGFGLISIILGAVTYILFNRLAGGAGP